jgi:PAS domain S-box-containing protein
LACLVAALLAVAFELAYPGFLGAPDSRGHSGPTPADAAIAALVVVFAAALVFKTLRRRRAPAAPALDSVSLQWLLALLVLATALPLVVLLAYHLKYEIAAEVDKADQLVQNLSTVTAADATASLTEFERLAVVLAARPRVAALDPAACDPMLGELARLYRNLANIATVAADGQAVCSVLAPPAGVLPNIGNPSWLQELRRSDRFAIGRPQQGLYTGRPVVVLAYPLHRRNAQGAETVAGAVELVVNLAAFQPLVSASLPRDGVAGIIDSEAYLIARSYRPEEVVGQNFRGTDVNQLILQRQSGTAPAMGRDGVERVYAFRPIANYRWYAVAGLPTASIYAQARRSAWRSAALGLAGLVAAALLVFSVYRRITAPMLALRQAARRVASGQLDTRAPESGPRELAEVAAGFNRMLDRIPVIESGLKQSEEHYRTLFDASPDALRVICDERVVMINPACLTMFGLASADEIVGASVYRNVHPDFLEVARERIRSVVQERRIAPLMEQVLLRADGSTAEVEVVSVPFEYRGRPAAVTIVHDLTARKAIERAVRRLNVELEQRVQQRTAELQRANQELEAFSYTVAHDLRAPLRSISGFAGLLREDHAGQLDAQGLVFAERIAAASETMDALISGLLALSRLGRAELVLENVDLSAAAGAIAAELAERDPARAVEFAIQPGLTARADRQLIRDVLENLLGNAWKFTSGHARARIEFGAAAADSGNEVTYYVRDDGAGFDPRFAGKLFGSFQRLHTRIEFPGSGIGLASVRRIIQNHGGRVWAQGAVEQGAVFYFTLPVRAPG